MSAQAPGLQHERTVLAWRRTSLAMLANGVLLLLHPAGGAAPRPLLAGASALLAAAVFGVGSARRRALQTRPQTAVVITSWHLTAVGAGLAALAAFVIGTLA